jgi:hypothetical protein
MERRPATANRHGDPAGSSAQGWENVPPIVEGCSATAPELAAPTLRVQTVAGRVAISVDELRVPTCGAPPLPAVRVIQKESHAHTVGRLVYLTSVMASLSGIERVIRDYSEMEGSPD